MSFTNYLFHLCVSLLAILFHLVPELGIFAVSPLDAISVLAITLNTLGFG